MSTAAILPADSDGVARAAAMLRAGDLVAFPTETVYGLGADATQDRAVAKIYAAKGRPSFNPLIVHVDTADKLDRLIIWNDQARLLAGRFWPGPLTLVLPVAEYCPVSLLARAGLPTLAVRIPAHPVAQALLAAAGVPLAAPSANRSGSLSPTTPLHVQDSLPGIPVIAGGKAQVGIESTILDLTGLTPALLRPGGVSLEQIAQCLGRPVTMASPDEAIKAPGMLASHYAPRLPLRINVTAARPFEAFILFGPELGLRGGVLRKNLSPSGDLHEAAANLFAYLHECDAASGLAGIAVSSIPETGLGCAINDRLRRAVTPP